MRQLWCEAARLDASFLIQRELPAQDWKLDPWEGTDPFGKPTSGFIMERGTENAAMSVTDSEDVFVATIASVLRRAGWISIVLADARSGETASLKPSASSDATSGGV